jgi:hypothetical protein
MASDTTFTVKIGKIARTLEYEDADGRMMFAFDGSPKGPKHLVLEHGAMDGDVKTEIPRGARYDIAFERTRQYLLSRGYPRCLTKRCSQQPESPPFG